MGIKRIIRKIAKIILESSPEKSVTVNIAQIDTGKTLAGRNIIITGGGKGIGYAISKKCIAEGANIIIVGRNEQSLKDASNSLGDKCKYLVFDITKVEKAKELIKKCDNLFDGNIDSIVANAGISLHENIYKNVTIEGFDKQFNTNLRANYFLAKEFLEYLENRGGNNGNLIFISSETGSECYDIPYGLTKAAINSLTGALSRRVYTKGIRVNAIAPGVTKTDMVKDYIDVEDKNLYRKSSSERVFLPEEIAEVAWFLLSDASKCISGEVIHCDAGNHLKVFWE